MLSKPIAREEQRHDRIQADERCGEAECHLLARDDVQGVAADVEDPGGDDHAPGHRSAVEAPQRNDQRCDPGRGRATEHQRPERIPTAGREVEQDIPGTEAERRQTGEGERSAPDLVA